MGSIPYDSICGVSYLSNIRCKHFQSNFAEGLEGLQLLSY